MKQSFILCTKELFRGSDKVCKYTFKTMNTRDNCAPRSNHQLTQIFAATREGSALFTIVCPVLIAISGLTRDYSAYFHKKDGFECLSPYETPA